MFPVVGPLTISLASAGELGGPDEVAGLRGAAVGDGIGGTGVDVGSGVDVGVASVGIDMAVSLPEDDPFSGPVSELLGEHARNNMAARVGIMSSLLTECITRTF